MATITTRAGKGSPLTNTEVDANFTNLNTDKLESTDLSVSTGAASGGGTLSYSAGVFTFAPADLSSYIVDLSSFTTTDLTEGTNLYYTDERVDDRVNSLIQAGLGITTSYDDINNELTIESDTIEELCKNGTASTIAKGTPVYQTGTAGNAMVIAPADASSAATMPAVGVLSQDLAAAAEGSLILMGRISGVNTSTFSEGDVIYVANGGGYTNVRPTGQSVLVQNLGRVTKVDATNGGGVVMGSGRANDVPNLTNGNVFIGNAGGTYDKRAIVTADISDLTATATELNYTDGVTSNIQTQLDTKAPLASPTFTGTATMDGLTVGAVSYPSTDGTTGQALVTDGSGNVSFSTIQGYSDSDVDTHLNTSTATTNQVLSWNGSDYGWIDGGGDPTLGTQTKTYTSYETSEISLSSSVLSPSVNVIKEIPQTAVTSNRWDAAAGTYEFENTAPSTSLSYQGYDTSTASFSFVEALSGNTGNQEDIQFNNDGTKMFLLSRTYNNVSEWSLSTAYDVSTKSLNGYFSIGSQDANPRGLTFNNDGTKMYMVGVTNDTVYQYSLSTAFDISTASYASISFYVGSQEAIPCGLRFNNDGTKMFINGFNDDEFNEYSLSTAYNVSTASYVRNLYTGLFPRGMEFNSDGTKIYFVDDTNNSVYMATLSTAFNISTAGSFTQFSVSSEETAPCGMTFNNDGTKMYIVGESNEINVYNLSASFVLGTGSFSSTDVGKIISWNEGKFHLLNTSGAVTQLTAPTSTGTAASGEWQLTGLNYDSTNDRINLYSIQNTFDIDSATYTNKSFFAQIGTNNTPTDMSWSADGTKLFINSYDDATIYSYPASTAFDLNTVSTTSNGNLYYGSQLSNCYAMYITRNGENVYLASYSTSGVISHFTLSTPFNLSTGSITSTFYASDINNDMGTYLRWSIFVSDDGNYLYIGDSNYKINRWTLTNPYNVSAHTAFQYKQISSLIGSYDITSFIFNTTGTKLYLCVPLLSNIYELDLSVPFDVTSITYNSVNASVGQNNIYGLYIDPDGTSLFYISMSDYYIREYSISSTIVSRDYEIGYGSNIDTTYWTDINSLTVTDSINDGVIYYFISDDNRTTWSIVNSSGQKRDIARVSGGTWQYNSNTTYGSETWTNATSNSERQALVDAIGVSVNQWTGSQVSAISDANQITLTNDLSFGFMMYFASGSTSPTYSGTALNYDAAVLNKGAINGVDYEYDCPAQNKVRITALNPGNYKIRVL